MQEVTNHRWKGLFRIQKNINKKNIIPVIMQLSLQSKHDLIV